MSSNYQPIEGGSVDLILAFLRTQPAGAEFVFSQLRKHGGLNPNGHSALLKAIEAGMLEKRKGGRYRLGLVVPEARPDRRRQARPRQQRETDLLIPDAVTDPVNQRSVGAARQMLRVGAVDTGHPLRAVVAMLDAADAVLARRTDAAVDLVVAERLRGVSLAADAAAAGLRNLLETL